MGHIKPQIFKLHEIIENLDSYEDNLLICAVTDPIWHRLSKAIICSMSADGKPNLGKNMGDMEYLLEVGIAKEVLDVWQEWRNGKVPSNDEKVDAIIYYATNDAYKLPE